MGTGAITQHIDVAQLALYAFWLFFLGLVIYLQKEGKREGFPLVDGKSGEDIYVGVPMPGPKTFVLEDGTTRTVPDAVGDRGRDFAMRDAYGHYGSPYVPTGDPLADGIGPSGYALRMEKPELTHEGQAKIVPMRVANQFSVAEGDPDPRGMVVVGCDNKVAGTVSDIWVDREEMMIRYLEVELPADVVAEEDTRRGEEQGDMAGPRYVLLPMNMARVDGVRRAVKAHSITAAQFTQVPTLINPEQVTLREEDRVMAYFAGGHLYATPDRQEPLI